MAQSSAGLPTYEFVNDPLPPRARTPRGQAELAPQAFRPVQTVRMDDVEFRVTERVDGGTPWRETGNTDFESFRAAISRTHPPAERSPLVAEARAVYDVVSEAGLSRFAAAMLWHEKKNDTWRDTPIPKHFHNPFSTKDRARPGEWERFATYAEAARAWVARIDKDPYPQNGSIRDFVNIYAPSSENDVDRYVTVLAEEINSLPVQDALPAPRKGKAVSIPGLPRPIFVPTDLVVEVALVPEDHVNNRPGLPMTPRSYTQHDTDNPRTGMGADAHSRWLDAGAEGGADNQVGFHVLVDDTKVIVKTPFDEVQWHAGDSDGPGNMTSIACELCVNNDRNVDRAERNAAVFAAAVIRDGLQKGIEALLPHQHWSGKECPRSLLASWDRFRQSVARLVAEGAAPPPQFPGLPPTMPAEVLLALFPEANPDGPVTKFYIDHCVKHMPPGQWPRFNGAKDLSDGSRWWDFNPLHIFSNPEGKVWIAGDADRPTTSATATGTKAQGDLERPDGRAEEPPRDFAQKDAAMARDLHRRLVVTTSDTDLVESPRGATVRTLPTGTTLTVLGDAEDGFVPVAGGDGGSERGYVRESAVASRPDVLERPPDRDRDREREREKEREKDRDRRRKAPGKGAEPGGTKPSTKPKTPNGRGDTGRSGTAGGRRPTGGSPTTGTSGDAGDRIAAEAQGYVGRPYVWASHGPDTFDCSGLVHWVVLQATGQNISPDSHAQFNLGTPVEWDLLRPGDILFYDTMGGGEVREGNAASHVGIYVREGSMINALNPDSGVVDSDPFSDYFKPLYLGARRLA